VIFTMIGSLLMLVAIFYVYVKAAPVLGGYTTDLEKLARCRCRTTRRSVLRGVRLSVRHQVPLFPLHTWLPDAHVEAPTRLVILAGVMLKFGIYGFLRYAFPLFPHGGMVWAPALAVLAVIGIIYGGSSRSRRTTSRSSSRTRRSRTRFCMARRGRDVDDGHRGLDLRDAVARLTTGGLFLGIGVLYERRHTRGCRSTAGSEARCRFSRACSSSS